MTALLVIVLLVLATVVLIRSMSTRLANVKRNAPHWPADDDGPQPDDGQGERPPANPSA